MLLCFKGERLRLEITERSELTSKLQVLNFFFLIIEDVFDSLLGNGVILLILLKNNY